MKPTLANSVSPSERSHLFHICEKKIALSCGIVYPLEGQKYPIPHIKA